jgi:putative PIN family toxin of toxin-antitoxin system
VRRLVVDTNVIVSSLFGGPPRELLALWERSEFTLCLSDAVADEYRAVLQRFARFRHAADAFLANLAVRDNVLMIPSPSPVRAVLDDPDDDVFLACALAAGADWIVSGDDHLLRLASFRGIPILTPVEAVRVVCSEA